MAQSSHTFDYDLIVIGSGAGGSAAATIAARAGKRVAIIESDTFGGDSPNWSDVPTCTLLDYTTKLDMATSSAFAHRRLDITTLQFVPGKNWPSSELVLPETVNFMKVTASTRSTQPPISLVRTRLALIVVTFRLATS